MSDEAPNEASREDADEEDEASGEAAVEAAPPPKKKSAKSTRSSRADEARRRRKPARRAPDDDEGPARPPLREGVPAFAQSFPSDPGLDALVAAFEAGDYARVRREAPALIQGTESSEVRKATRELVKRLDPDPIAVYLLGAAALLLVFLAGWFWMHPHELP